MSRHRFFLTGPLPSHTRESMTLPLTADDLHHAVGVVRVRSGEQIEVAEPGGTVWVVRVEQAGVKALSATPVEQLAPAPPEPYVMLVQGVAKGEKMDEIVRYAVEIGAREVVPVLFSRTVVKLDAAKRAERGKRWRRIAKSAAEQAHRTSVPTVHDPVSANALDAMLAEFDRVVVLWEEAAADGQGIAVALAGVSGASPDGQPRVALVVGPEGGLAADEVEALEAVGARVVTLGANVLRTQTAALVGLALVVHELGGLGNAR